MSIGEKEIQELDKQIGRLQAVEAVMDWLIKNQSEVSPAAKVKLLGVLENLRK